jgi:hypothetical protein
MTSPRWPEILYRRLPAAEQAAHPKSGPRRRPHELPKSFRTHGDSSRTTHITRSPTEPVRFNQKVWRYMSFSRFAWMLQRRQLWLSRADLLGDPWEMAPSHSQVELAQRVHHLESVEPWKWEPPLQHSIQQARSRAFINCWTAQHHESHALWRIYCGGSTDGVAIQTTFSKLASSVSGSGAEVHGVIYRDPEGRPFEQNLLLTKLAIEKRPMFDYEREVRVILKLSHASNELGMPLPWNPETVLENIYVHPGADESLMETTKGIVEHHAPALGRSVEWSSMRLKPPF